MSRQSRREDSVMAIAMAHGILVGAVIALLGDMSIGPVRLWLLAGMTGAVVFGVIARTGFWYVDRLYRQGR